MNRNKKEYSIADLAQLVAAEYKLDVGVAMEFARLLEYEIQVALCAGKRITVERYLWFKLCQDGKVTGRQMQKMKVLKKQLEKDEILPKKTGKK